VSSIRGAILPKDRRSTKRSAYQTKTSSLSSATHKPTVMAYPADTLEIWIVLTKSPARLRLTDGVLRLPSLRTNVQIPITSATDALSESVDVPKAAHDGPIDLTPTRYRYGSAGGRGAPPEIGSTQADFTSPRR